MIFSGASGYRFVSISLFEIQDLAFVFIYFLLSCFYRYLFC